MPENDFEVAIDIKAELRHLPALIEFSRLFFEGLLGYSEKSYLVYSLQLVITEACTNVMRHAYATGTGGKLTLAIKKNGDDVIIRVTDDGQDYNPATIPSPDLDDPKSHGLGLFIIRQFVDSFHHERRDGQNVLTLVKRVDPLPDSSEAPPRA